MSLWDSFGSQLYNYETCTGFDSFYTTNWIIEYSAWFLLNDKLYSKVTLSCCSPHLNKGTDKVNRYTPRFYDCNFFFLLRGKKTEALHTDCLFQLVSLTPVPKTRVKIALDLDKIHCHRSYKTVDYLPCRSSSPCTKLKAGKYSPFSFIKEGFGLVLLRLPNEVYLDPLVRGSTICYRYPLS